MPKKPQVPEVLKAIEKQLQIKRSQIYARASKLATKVQADTETGLYLLAAQSGVNLRRHLPKDELDRIRGLLFQVGEGNASGPSVRARGKSVTVKAVTVTVGKNLTIRDPIISARVLEEAKTMAEEVYPLLYVFENSVRALVVRIMEDRYGAGWWDAQVSREIREEVQRRKATEDRNPWHGKRGAHPIFYTDLEHLGRIVQSNWTAFKQILPSAQWISQRLEELSHSRNPIAHMNPLAKEDVERVRVYTRDWEKLVAAKRVGIPGSLIRGRGASQTRHNTN